MSYYSDYEEDQLENDGNSESKWDPIADTNIIKGAMSVLAMITKQNGTIGQVSSLNYKKQGDGQTMNLNLVISGAGWTMNWVNTDSADFKNCNFVFLLTEEDNLTDLLRL